MDTVPKCIMDQALQLPKVFTILLAPKNIPWLIMKLLTTGFLTDPPKRAITMLNMKSFANKWSAMEWLVEHMVE